MVRPPIKPFGEFHRLHHCRQNSAGRPAKPMRFYLPTLHRASPVRCQTTPRVSPRLIFGGICYRPAVVQISYRGRFPSLRKCAIFRNDRWGNLRGSSGPSTLFNTSLPPDPKSDSPPAWSSPTRQTVTTSPMSHPSLLTKEEQRPPLKLLSIVIRPETRKAASKATVRHLPPRTRLPPRAPMKSSSSTTDRPTGHGKSLPV